MQDSYIDCIFAVSKIDLEYHLQYQKENRIMKSTKEVNLVDIINEGNDRLAYSWEVYSTNGGYICSVNSEDMQALVESGIVQAAPFGRTVTDEKYVPVVRALECKEKYVLELESGRKVETTNIDTMLKLIQTALDVATNNCPGQFYEKLDGETFNIAN